MTDTELVGLARKAREFARAPFSNFKVGAAVEDEQGNVYTGCNIENASYGLTLCAERVAVFKALSEGAQKLVRVAVVADTTTLTPPCGACRQILWEFCGNAPLIMSNLGGATKLFQMIELLPHPFDARFLTELE